MCYCNKLSNTNVGNSELMVQLKNVVMLQEMLFSMVSHERLESNFAALVLLEQPRTNLAALFCASCNFARFVLDADDHTVQQ